VKPEKPEAIQPSYSRAARSIHGPLCQAARMIGGLPTTLVAG
jgi:hypothetical protein